MNYFSHYLVLPRRDDPHLTLGGILPDLLRDSKIDVQTLQTINSTSLSEGIINHIRTDAAFHNSPFFKQLTSAISKSVRKDSTISINKYTYFLAHILLELYMDHILITQNTMQLDLFYDMLQQVDKEKIKTFFKKHLPNHDYELFQLKMSNFVSRKFLYNYKDEYAVGRIASMLFEKVNIGSISVEDQKRLVLLLINQYQEPIQAQLPSLFNDLK